MDESQTHIFHTDYSISKYICDFWHLYLWKIWINIFPLNIIEILSVFQNDFF